VTLRGKGAAHRRFSDGRCEEALEFYRKAVGAELTMMMRYKESPEPAQTPPGRENKVLHASFSLGETVVMASDGHYEREPNHDGFALALSVPAADAAERAFAALAEGGQVQMPLAKTFFSPRFGMVTDRFGVLWMVMVEAAPRD
jgi:PhnB protein